VHQLLAAWRALLSIVAPLVVLKAEAIERLEDVKAYFGADAGAPECHLAYDNGVMTALWASLALGSAEPARCLIDAAKAKPLSGTWVNYVRCHDDIIWSALSPYVTSEDQAYCSRFFAGTASATFSAGAAFQSAAGTAASTNGMTTSLVGVVSDDPDLLPARRLLLLYGVIYALDGIPVLWMGDEIGLGGNADTAQGMVAPRDGRWLQRPPMDWSRADQRKDVTHLPGRAFQVLASFAKLRAVLLPFSANHVANPVFSGDPAVLSFLRGDAHNAIQCLANFSPDPRSGRLALQSAGSETWWDLLRGHAGEGSTVPLDPYQVRWLVARS
jgi:amylosucrase